MLSPIFIPILMQESAIEDRDRASETFSHVANFVLLLLVAACAVCAVTARYWLFWLFGGFDNATKTLAVQLTYIIFPAVIFLAVSGILTAVLNGFHRFALAAFAPALGSIAVISGVALARGPSGVYVVAVATAAGFLAQFLVLVPLTRSLGIRYRPVLNLKHPAIGKLLRLGIPLFLYMAVANAAGLLERNLASHLSAGAVSTLSYALRLFLVPANFMVAPLATVVYPGLAREAARENYEELRKQVSRTLRVVFLLFLPATVFVALNALPITRLLYERGQFHFQDSFITARVLAIYSAAILPYSATVIALRCLYAMQDTVLPLKAEVINLAYFAVVAIVLTQRYGLLGLAVGRTTTFFLVAAIVLGVLGKRLELLHWDGETASFLLRTAAATIGMGVLSWLGWHFSEPVFNSGKTFLRLAIVAFQIVISGSAYAAMAIALRLNEARGILATVRDFLSGGIARINGSTA
jgi:putative peptidoglycan lipid II flippase